MREIFLYLPSKILPGFLAIVTISLLTRSLPIEEFGRYSYLLSVGLFITVSLFSWLTLGVNRHYFNEDNEVDIKTKESALIISLIIFIITCSALVVSVFLFDISYIYILVLMVAWLNGLFDLLQQASILENKKLTYSLSVSVRPLFLFLIALVAFISKEIDSTDLLLVIIASYMLSCSFLYFHGWKEINIFNFHTKEISNIFHYGIPLTLNFGLMYVVSSSDKLLISHYLTERDIGIYSASYDLFSQIIFGFGSILTLVLFPKSLKAYNKGTPYFRVTTKRNIKVSILYLVILLVALVSFSPLIVNVCLAKSYHAFAKQYFILIVVMTALYCFYSYVFIPILQLEKRINKILLCSLVMAMTNIIINISYLKEYGIKVGIYSTFVSYILGFLMCLFFTKHVWLGKSE